MKYNICVLDVRNNATFWETDTEPVLRNDTYELVIFYKPGGRVVFNRDHVIKFQVDTTP